MSMMVRSEPTVVLIEDEPQIRRFLHITLSEQGFLLIEASSGADGVARVEANSPDLVLLDLGLPDVDGLDVCRLIRQGSTVPIIVLSARDQEAQKIAALDAGADDYVTKPFGVGELLARMRATLRRVSLPSTNFKEEVFRAGDITIDFEKRLVMLNETEVHLTPNEYAVLMVLVENSGKVVTHKQLLKAVWGDSCLKETHYVRVYMAQLRHKLEPDPARPKHLTTEPGVGYRFRA